MASSDSRDERNPKSDRDETKAQEERTRASSSKASDLFARAPQPDASELPADSHEIVSLPGKRKKGTDFKASDLFSLAPAPASSEQPSQKDSPKTEKNATSSRRRNRVEDFKASEMLGAALTNDSSEGDLPPQLTNVDKRVYGPREFATVLVVLLFAGIVGWILVGHQQEDAQRTVCAGNLRDLGLALFQYAQDNDECLPNRLTGWPGSVTAWNEQEGYTWRRAVAPYFKNKAAFRCPTNPKNTQPAGCQIVACGPERVTDGYDVSYACNYNNGLGGGDNAMGNGYCGGKGASPVRLSGLASPSQMIAVVETVSPWSEFDVLKPAFADAIYTGHHGRSNYLFADGHVASLAPVQTLNFWRGDGHRFSLSEREAARSVLGVR